MLRGCVVRAASDASSIAMRMPNYKPPSVKRSRVVCLIPMRCTWHLSSAAKTSASATRRRRSACQHQGARCPRHPASNGSLPCLP